MEMRPQYFLFLEYGPLRRSIFGVRRFERRFDVAERKA
jgi:hypothetical protein